MDALSVVLEKGGLADALSRAKELRVLKLSFQCDIDPQEDELSGMTTPLEHVLRDHHYPHLYELSICNCVVDEIYLKDLLLRHKSTLRRLSMSWIKLREGSWDSFFQSIGGKLPALKSARLYWYFESEECACEYAFSYDKPSRIAPMRDAIEILSSQVVNGPTQESCPNSPAFCRKWTDTSARARPKDMVERLTIRRTSTRMTSSTREWLME